MNLFLAIYFFGFILTLLFLIITLCHRDVFLSMVGVILWPIFWIILIIAQFYDIGNFFNFKK